jgi:Protein of unknown function (DUF1554)
MAIFSKKHLITSTIVLLSLVSCGQNKGLAPGSSSSNKPSCTTCRIFVTALAFDGNLGGVTGADAKCMAASNKPSDGGTYKALLAGTTREMTGPDWVLQANTIYTRPDGTTIGTTTASKNFAPMNTSISAYYSTIWTGLYTDYSVDSTHCNYWTTNAGGSSGATGASDSTYQAVNIGMGRACNNLQKLYCVEQ